MADMIKKLVNVEVKEVGERTLEIAGSTETKDRMGDIIRVDGWNIKQFKKNPVFMWAHRYDEPPIGRANKVWIDKEGKKLMFHIEFAPPETYEFADTIYKLYKGGFLHATSVGFMPLDWEGKDDEHSLPAWEGNIFTKQELLELSGAPVPTNPDALVSARDQGLITVKEFDAFHKEMELVTKPEETDDYIRIPVKGEEGKHDDHKIRTIDVDKDKGIKALYCVDCKKIITYLFSKDEGWTMASAQDWVDEHSKSITSQLYQLNIEIAEALKDSEDAEDNADDKPKEKAINQEQLCDELDYICNCIDQVGLSQEAQEMSFNLVRRVVRLAGADIPDDILENIEALLKAKQSGEADDEEIPDIAHKLEPEDVEAIVAGTIDYLRGKVN